MNSQVILNSQVSVEYSGGDEVESFQAEEEALDTSNSIPPHPLGVKPSGNQYSALVISKNFIGLSFKVWPDEILALFLEYLEPSELRLLGSTCKFLHAFCRADDLWKSLFIE